jgi:hypothetical protein
MYPSSFNYPHIKENLREFQFGAVKDEVVTNMHMQVVT